MHTEHLNTPRLVADSAGVAVWRWDQLEPFGVNVPDENPSSLGAFEYPLRFPGQYADKETGLHYNYFRDYDPGAGRYVESDPIGVKGGRNTYLYSEGTPLLLIDPDGLRPYASPVGPNIGSKLGNLNYSPPSFNPLFATTQSACAEKCRLDFVIHSALIDGTIHGVGHVISSVSRFVPFASTVSLAFAFDALLECVRRCSNASCVPVPSN